MPWIGWDGGWIFGKAARRAASACYGKLDGVFHENWFFGLGVGGNLNPV